MSHSLAPRHSSVPLADDPILMLVDDHAVQRRLCDQLEAIADGLPQRPDVSLCLSVIATIETDMPLHHADEELGLFPLLRERSFPDDRMDDVLLQLEEEHMACEAQSAEVVLALSGLVDVKSAPLPAPEAAVVGYVLRGFFEARRNHIAWEEATVYPMALARLGMCDRQVLQAAVSRNRRDRRPDAFARQADRVRPAPTARGDRSLG